MNQLLSFGWPLSQPSIERLGWVLVQSLWQFALVALVARVAIGGMRHASAVSRYAMLGLSLAVVVAAPIVTWNLQEVAPPALAEASEAENTVVADQPGLASHADEPMPETAAASNVSRTSETANVAVPAEEGQGAAIPVAPMPLTERITRLLQPWLGWIVAAWSLGVVLCATRPLFGWYMLRRLERVGVMPAPEEIVAATGRMAARLGVRRVVRVLQSTLTGVPIVVGYFRPAILLPVSLVTTIPALQLEAILAHELAHVRRHDFVVNLLQTLVETLFFYHPAVWWLSHQLRVEREHCCDDLVIGVLGNRLEYGRALVAIEELRGRSPVLALGAGSGSLLSRIRRIAGLAPEAAGKRGRLPVASVGLVCLAVALLLFVSLSLAARDDGPTASGPTMATLPGEITVELIGVGYHPSKDREWWKADGTALERPPTLSNHEFSVMPDSPEQAQCREFILQIRGLPRDHAVTTDYGPVAGATGSSYSDGLWVGEHGAGPFKTDTTSIRVGLTTDAFGPTISIDASGKKESDRKLPRELKPFYARMSPLGVEEWDGKAALVFDASFSELGKSAGWELKAVDREGTTYRSTSQQGTPAGKLLLLFDLPRERLVRFEFRLRPYRQWVTFENVSLKPGKKTPVNVTTTSTPGLETVGPRFLDELRIDLKRAAAHGGRWFFVDLDQGRVATPPFEVELDQEKLPFTVLRPTEQQLKTWLMENGIDLMLYAGQSPLGDGTGRVRIAVTTRAVRTNLGSRIDLVETPHTEGQPWRYQNRPADVVATFARRNDTIGVSGFVPSSSAGFEVRPDNPDLRVFRTAENVVGMYLLERNDLTKDELSLRIVHVAGVSTPLTDVSFDGQVVKGAFGAADPPRVVQPLVAKLPGGFELELVGVSTSPLELPSKDRRDWWRGDGAPLARAPLELGSLIVSPERIDGREFAFRVRGSGPQPKIMVHIPTGGKWSYAQFSWDEKSPQAQGALHEVIGSFGEVDATALEVDVSLGLPLTFAFDRDGKEINPMAAAEEEKPALPQEFRVLRAAPFEQGVAVWTRRAISSSGAASGLVAIDKSGSEHSPATAAPDGKEHRNVFNVPHADVVRFEVRIPRFVHRITFENVSLKPGQRTEATVKVAAPDDALAQGGGPLVARIPGGPEVALVGVTNNTRPTGEGWFPDGSPLTGAGEWPAQNVITHKDTTTSIGNGGSDPPDSAARDLLLQIRGLKAQPSYRLNGSNGAAGWSHLPLADPYQNRLSIRPHKPMEQATFTLLITDAPWGPPRRISTDKVIFPEDEEREIYAANYAQVQFQKVVPMDDDPERFALVFRQPQEDKRLYEYSIRAVDKDGREHPAHLLEEKGIEGTDQVEARWGLFSRLPDGKRFSHFAFRLRPYQHRVTFENVSLVPGHRSDAQVRFETLSGAVAARENRSRPATFKFPPPKREDVLGLDLAQVKVRPFSEAEKETPELYLPDPRNPEVWSSPRNVYSMPLAEHTWLKYPAGNGHFYIEHRPDGTPESEVVYGPIAGNPFEVLQLNALIRERMKTKGPFSDSRFWSSLMFATLDPDLIRRAWGYVAPELEALVVEDKLSRAKSLQRDEHVFDRIALLERVRDALRDDAFDFRKPELAALAVRMREVVTTIEPVIDAHNDLVADATYESVTGGESEIPSKIPDGLWGKPMDGLRLALVPEEESMPTSITVSPDREVAYRLVVENVSDREIKMSGYLDSNGSFEVFDLAERPVMTGSVRISTFPIRSYWRLKPGERKLVSMSSVHFVTDANDTAKGRIGQLVHDARGDYTVRGTFVFGDLDTNRHRYVPGQSEWIGKLSTGSQKIRVVMASDKTQSNGGGAARRTPTGPSVAKELEQLQGVWRFEIIQTDGWPKPAGKGPDRLGRGDDRQWTIRQNEITWTSPRGEEVKGAFTIDPTKSPKHFDVTFLGGPHKGQTCIGVYERGGLDGKTLWLCLVDPGSKAGRPTNISFESNSGRSMIGLIPLQAPGVRSGDDAKSEQVAKPVGSGANRFPKSEDIFARKISLQAKAMPLKLALADLARQAGVALELDVEALKKVDLDVDEPVTASITDEPLTDAIGQLIDWRDHPGAFRELRDGTLVLTTISAMQERIASHLPDWLKPLYRQGLLATLDDQRQVVSITTSSIATDELLEKFATLPKLRELNVEVSKAITSAGMKHLGRMPLLEKLTLYHLGEEGRGVGDAAFEAVAGLPALREVSISGCGSTDAGVRFLEKVPQLTRLKLNEDGRITDAALQSIGRLTRLKDLDLSLSASTEQHGKMHFTAAGLKALAGLKELEGLHLQGQEVTADFLSFPKLTSLSLGGMTVDDACAERIAACRELQSLSLVFTRVTDAGMKAISTLPALRHLNIDSDFITDAGIEPLKGLRMLELLTLRATKFTDVSLRHISEIKSLTRLDLHGSGLPGSAVSELFTMEGIRQLKALPNLRTLWLNNLQSSAGFMPLRELTQLRELTLMMTNLRSDELEALETALPKTTIHHITGGGIAQPKAKRRRPSKSAGVSNSEGKSESNLSANEPASGKAAENVA